VWRLEDVIANTKTTAMFIEPWDKAVATHEGEKVNCLSRIW